VVFPIKGFHVKILSLLGVVHYFISHSHTLTL